MGLPAAVTGVYVGYRSGDIGEALDRDDGATWVFLLRYLYAASPEFGVDPTIELSPPGSPKKMAQKWHKPLAWS